MHGDSYAGTLPVRLPPDVLRRLSAVNAWRSSAHITLQWILIAGAIVLCMRFFNPLLYVVTVAWIGARQHALGILMHDGAHYRLYRNKLLNDWVANILCLWPLLYTVERFRRIHWAHHRLPNTPDDPVWMDRLDVDWSYPKTRAALAWLLLRDVVGVNLVRDVMRLAGGARAVVSRPPAAPRRLTIRGLVRAAYCVTVFAIVGYAGLWRELFLFWIVPFFSWLQAILRLRAIGEHYALANADSLDRTRTTIPSLFDRLFIAPYSIGYHIEHHLFPSVPFHRLRQLHEELMRQPVFRSRAHVTDGYLGVLRECLSGPSRQPS